MLETLPFSTNIKKAAKELLPLAFTVNMAIFGLVGCKSEEAVSHDEATSVPMQSHSVPLYTDLEMIQNAQYTYTQFRANMNKPDSALDIILETNIALEIMNANPKKVLWLEAARQSCKTSGMSKNHILDEFVRLAQNMPPTPAYTKTGDQHAVYFMALLAEYAESKKR